MKGTTPHWVAIILLLAVIVGIGIKFIVLGSTADPDSEDGRIQVLLNAGERQAVLLEMQSLLEATQQIVEGLASNNTKQIADAGSSVGMQATSTMDVTLKAKLPLEFKKLGFATHAAFDEIAAMANKGVDTAAMQKKLATTMNNCIACHASFQLPISISKGEQQ
ncbi:MAG: hypothetical protein ACE5DY_03750 [Mariprofundaceae bacterium]